MQAEFRKLRSCCSLPFLSIDTEVDMNEFPVIPATKKSLSQRKPVFGIGINNAKYMIHITVNGKKVMCPFYNNWHNMLQRCYNPEYHEKYPTYKDCFVCDEWLTFSNFRSWMCDHNWLGKCLDKDILFTGNKEYHPDKCIFVSHYVNKILNENAAKRGSYALGVYKVKNRYYSGIKINSKSIFLGSFKTERQAHEAYKKAKYAEVVRVAFTQEEMRVTEGLLKHAVNILIN